MRKAYIFLALVVVVLFVALSSFFVVDERERALVLQFGEVRSVKQEPGLAFKVPFIQNVVTFDDRILSLDTDPIEVTPSDDRRLIVDAFARYRIEDVEQFYRAVGIGGIGIAEGRLANILVSQTRAVLGSDGVTSNTILSEDRSILMTRIRDLARESADSLGIDIIDVRLKQTALPDQNLTATFERMRAEREREATDERARGEEAAQRVRAQADRTRVELVSDAQREANITRGEADAERNSIYAEAFGADAGFFEFYRSLAAYESALQEGNSTLILSPDSEFFSYLKSSTPNSESGAGSAAPSGGSAEPAASEGEDAAAATLPATGSDAEGDEAAAQTN